MTDKMMQMPKMLLSTSLGKKYFCDLLYDEKENDILCILEVPCSSKEDVELAHGEKNILEVITQSFHRKVICNFPLKEAKITATFRSRYLEIRIKPHTLPPDQWIIKLSI